MPSMTYLYVPTFHFYFYKFLLFSLCVCVYFYICTFPYFLAPLDASYIFSLTQPCYFYWGTRGPVHGICMLWWEGGSLQLGLCPLVVQEPHNRPHCRGRPYPPAEALPAGCLSSLFGLTAGLRDPLPRRMRPCPPAAALQAREPGNTSLG